MNAMVSEVECDRGRTAILDEIRENDGVTTLTSMSQVEIFVYCIIRHVVHIVHTSTLKSCRKTILIIFSSFQHQMLMLVDPSCR